MCKIAESAQWAKGGEREREGEGRGREREVVQMPSHVHQQAKLNFCTQFCIVLSDWGAMLKRLFSQPPEVLTLFFYFLPFQQSSHGNFRGFSHFSVPFATSRKYYDYYCIVYILLKELLHAIHDTHAPNYTTWTRHRTEVFWRSGSVIIEILQSSTSFHGVFIDPSADSRLYYPITCPCGNNTYTRLTISFCINSHSECMHACIYLYYALFVSGERLTQVSI